ncbi:MAG: NADH-quinone oxidoreductase subunit M, partial [Candidatus Lightella neohaematopini]|nr:NADH-quinone oxidoreductase subunit M [Candidatus Lightella neohaematopini]
LIFKSLIMLLLWLIVIPIIGGVLCWQCERISNILSHIIAIITLLVEVLLFILIYQECQNTICANNTPWLLTYNIPWITTIGINFVLAIDNLTIVMLLLTILLGLISILCISVNDYSNIGLFYFNILIIISSTIGMFLSINMFLFLCFWEIVNIPIYFLTINFGYNQPINKTLCLKAATKFFIYSQISSLCILSVIVVLANTYHTNYDIWSFNYQDLVSLNLNKYTEYLLMLILFVAFAIKIPIVPLHNWYVDMQTYAPANGAMDLNGFLLKIAIYGIIRFCIPFFPISSNKFILIISIIGISNILYGAIMAFSQTDIKRVISYMNISHMGLLLIAVYNIYDTAYFGIIIFILSHSISAAGLIIMTGYFHKYLGTRNINNIGGLWDNMGIVPALLIILIISIFGLPGTGNFIGEFIILLANFNINPTLTIITIISLLLLIVPSLKIIQLICYGEYKLTNSVTFSVTKKDQLTLLLPVVIVLLLGLYPQLILNILF